MPLKIDLHMHTNFSDGAYSPFELVDLARNAGLNIISITDHDSVNAIDDAISYARQFGIEVIPGLEISTDLQNKEVHLLAYFIDHHNEELLKYLSFFRDERLYRAKRIIQKLQNIGIDITMDDVLEHSDNSAIGRPHIAYTLVDLGVVSNYYQAFEKYLGDYGPAYERKIHVSVQSALKLINDAGGLSFVAHPGFMKESVLIDLIKAGVDGIEVIHPSHSESQVNFYRGIVNEYCLLESGGSDFHGGKKQDDYTLGKYILPPNNLEAMRKMLHKNSA